MSTSGNILSVNYKYLDITEYWFASLLRVGVDGTCLVLYCTHLFVLYFLGKGLVM